jgi:O-antigen polymerase
MFIATIQSLYCLGQYLGVFHSQNEQFRVSGSWTNPNVTAEFLAMAMPVFLFLLQSKFKKIVHLSLIILVTAIGLLKCRSAYIGAVLSVLVFYALQYDFANWFKNPKNKSSRNALLIIALLFIIPTATQLYESKKASADGRQFIWKLSALMTIQKPLTGYGYGSFSKEYNLFQAKYIEEGKATLEEQHNAGPTITAHNELLQNAVEGGIVGLALVLFFWGSLFFSNREKSKEELVLNSISQPKDIADKNNLFYLAYSGIICFMAMSLFNFTYQAAPVATLFTIYSAIICSFSQPLKLPNFFLFLNRKWISILASAIIIISSSYFLYVLINIAFADSLNQKALLLKKEFKVNEALASMPKLAPWLKEESNYWENYALILFDKKEYQSSLNCLSKAKETSSSTDLYLGSGICYEKLKQYPQAIEQYKQLVLLHPSKFLYRYSLLNAYMQTKDTANVLIVAQSIIDLKPKIPSEEVVRYKEMAKKIRFAFDKNTEKI